MDREEAQKRGYEIKPSKQTIKKRAPWHDYRECGTYMITMAVSGRQPLLGELEVWEDGNLAQSARGQDGNLAQSARGQDAGHWRPLPKRVRPASGGYVERPAPGGYVERPASGGYVERPASGGNVERPAPGGYVAGIKARVALSPLGEAILKEELPKIHRFYPNVEVWRVCIMPDHIHIILRIVAPMREGKHLGSVICGFKTGCNKAYRGTCDKAAGGRTLGTGDGAAGGGTLDGAAGGGTLDGAAGGGTLGKGGGLFEPGYNDQILFNGEQLECWKRYLDDNPRRLALKRLYPDLFTIRHCRPVGQWSCQMVGNIFLLDIPDKCAVIYHRRYSEDEYQRLTAQWLACGERGGVLVSAAIHPNERAVINEAKSRRYRVVTLHENGFPPLYKPSGPDFNACTSGLLLQLSPWPYHHDRQPISRAQCMELNRLAEEIAMM